MRTIFIGDVHGCADELRNLLEKIDLRKNTDRLLLTGDAFTKGPHPLRVWEQICETGAEMVMGNHDAKLLEHFKTYLAAPTPDVLKPEHKRICDQLMPAVDPLIPWLETLPLWIANDAFLLVHAGVHPQKGLEGTRREEFLAIRTWPPVGGIEGPRWHDHYRPDDKLLVFGHDAPGGLVVKRRGDGRPYLIGLDSGCVYGNRLSGYILEENRIVQVESRQHGR